MTGGPQDFLRKIKNSEASVKQSKGTLLLIDLDKFKEVNDTMGHAAGDELLVSIAKRLSELAGSKGEVIRYGGDEFVIWYEGLDSVTAESVAQDIVFACRQPLLVNNNQFEIVRLIQIFFVNITVLMFNSYAVNLIALS